MVGAASTARLLGPLNYMFSQTLTLAGLTAVALFGLVFAFGSWRHWTLERIARSWLLVTSLSSIWLFTQHNPFQQHGRYVELDPFTDLQVAANTTGRYRDIVVANIVLFMPLGVALAWRGTRFTRMVALAAFVSTGVEVVQYLSDAGRISQTGDVLINVAGAVIGWATFVALTVGLGPLGKRERRSVAPTAAPARVRERSGV